MVEIAIIGGLGGHAGFAYAVAYYLNKIGIKPTVILPREHEWIRERLSRYSRVEEMTLPRNPGEPLRWTLPRWFRNLYESLTKVTRTYDAVLATGSNFSLIPGLTAWAKRIRLYNLESIDRIVDRGRTTSILYRFARITFLHWPEQLANYPRGLVAGPVYEPPTYEPYDGGYVLVTAGTLGNKELFDAMVETSLENVVLQTGRVDPRVYIEKKPSWRIFQYTARFDEVLAGASVVVTQFPGTTSATAALAYGKPVVMVPNRHVPLAASLANASIYSEKIGALYIERITPANLLDAIERAQKTKPPSYPNGAERIATMLAEN